MDDSALHTSYDVAKMCTVVCQQNIVEQLFHLAAWSYVSDGRQLYGGHSVNKNADMGLTENKNGLLRTRKQIKM